MQTEHRLLILPKLCSNLSSPVSLVSSRVSFLITLGLGPLTYKMQVIATYNYCENQKPMESDSGTQQAQIK